MGFSDLEDYLPEIKSFFSSKTNKLSKKRIFRALHERHDGATFQKEKSIERSKQILEFMNKIRSQPTLSMVDDLTRDEIRVIARLLEPHYPAGTVQHEYSQFQASALIEVCENLAAENEGKLQKESFVKTYLDMNGSLKFAEEFWSNLVSDIEGRQNLKEVLLADVEKNFEKATFNYRYFASEAEEEVEGNVDSDGHENRNKIPNSDYLSEPKGKKADFRDSEEEVHEHSKGNDKIEL